MKEEKSMLQLVRRYQTYPLSKTEQFGLGLMFAFFLAMFTLFCIIPNIF